MTPCETSLQGATPTEVLTQMALSVWGDLAQPSDPPTSPPPNLDPTRTAWVRLPGLPSPLPMCFTDSEIEAWQTLGPSRVLLSAAEPLLALTPPPLTSAKLAETVTSLLQLPYQPRELVYPFSLPKADQAESQKLTRRITSLTNVFESTLRLYDAPSLLLLWPYNYKVPLVLPIEVGNDF